MAHRQSMAHFETFARLHRASSGDLPRIRDFCEHVSAGSIIGGAGWEKMIQNEDTYILIATECQLIVGIGAVQHAPSAAEARLVFLCVLPDARGRGIGQLLLSTLVGRARSEGAALVHAQENAQGSSIGTALLRGGFTELGNGQWSFGLWNGHDATSYSNLSIPEHQPVAADDAAAQSLLMAMGTLDNAMMLTRKACQVLGHELTAMAPDVGARAMALAAARRGYFVRLDTGEAAALRQMSVPDTAERIADERDRLTPERILGHLSRGHLCLVRLAVSRLSGTSRRWYLINGFDGYLFRLHDVTQVNDPHDPTALTASELREGVARLTPADFVIIGKPL